MDVFVNRKFQVPSTHVYIDDSGQLLMDQLIKKTKEKDNKAKPSDNLDELQNPL